MNNAACCSCCGQGAHRAGTITPADDQFISVVLEEAKRGRDEGGIPIAAALVGADGSVLSVGRNQRVQKSSPVLHGEMDAFNNAGRLTSSTLRSSTLYTTLR
jgi:creatinine deaminase